MKKIIIIAAILISVVLANENDSTVTKLKVSDIKYYNVISPETNIGDPEVNSSKPFALIQPKDKWFSKDKWMHLSTSYFLTLQSAYTLEKMFYTRPENAKYISIGVSLSFSLGKELFDVFGKDAIFSWKDLAYDILGAGLGYLTVSALQE